MMQMMKRNILFILSILASLVAFYSPIRQLLGLSLHNELYSHIPLIPLMSGFFLFWSRKSIFSKVEYSFGAGATTIVTGALLGIAGFVGVTNHNQDDYLSLLTFSVWLTWIGSFILCYGFQSSKRASFPLLFLLFMIPLPSVVTQAAVQFLQRGSTEAASLLFTMLGMPVTRDGYVFHLPQFSIEVAKECSGIRSSIALIITGAIAGKLFLRSGWQRVLLAISLIPIAILKNAIRIVSLSVIGAFFDERIFEGDLHRKGGIVFFVIALFLVWAVIASLRKMDSQKGDRL
jgi:exosortase